MTDSYDMTKLLYEGCIQDLNVVVEECLVFDDLVVFILKGSSFEVGRVIGPWGVKTKVLSGIIRKRIKVIESSKRLEKFVANAVNARHRLKVDGTSATITLTTPDDLARVVGKNGQNADIIRTLLKRRFGIEKVEFRSKD
jgi:NusA-like KH domain protein